MPEKPVPMIAIEEGSGSFRLVPCPIAMKKALPRREYNLVREQTDDDDDKHDADNLVHGI